MDEKHYLYDEQDYDEGLSFALAAEDADVARALEEAAGADPISY